MPGIAGIIGGAPRQENAAALSQMVGSMLHEPFYTSGTYACEQLGLWVGWVSHGGSFTDCMPVWNEAKNVCLIFSGEDFTNRSEIDRLRTGGHQFDEENASYLVHFYEELGPGFFEKLNGWFSGVIIDLRSSRAFLFNDRYGLNRIYQCNAGDRFYFASEAKALLRILPDLRYLDLQSLGEYFSCGCPLQNRTLFAGVTMMPGGSAWEVSPGGAMSKRSYFLPATWESQTPLSAEDYYQSLKETWAAILPRYFRAKERVGISLTGGVDSRMIMAWAQEPERSLPCYTFGGMFRDCVDVKVARQVAAICRQPHEVIPVGRDFLDRFPSLAEKTVYLTDGAMDMTGSPDLYVNRMVREIAPVRLTGNYGGEILRNIVVFKPSSMDGRLFDRQLAGHIQATAKTYSSEFDGRKLPFVAFKQVPWHHYSRLALELSQLTLRSPYLDNDLVALAFRMPAEAASSNEVQLRLIADGNPALGHIGTDRGLLYRSTPAITRLRHLYQEFTFKAEYAYDYGMPQWLARLDGTFRPFHIERLFLGRHKFYHFRLWYREELSRYIRDVLLDPRSLSRAYLNGKRLEEIVKGHTEGHQNFTREIHRILSIELLHRQLIEMK